MNTFQTAGAVLATILLIFQLFDRIPPLRRFCLGFASTPKRWWKLVNEWRYWRSHHPICAVLPIGSLKISKADSPYDYVLDIELEIECQGRDEYPTSVNKIWMEIESEKHNEPFRLFNLDHSELPILPPIDGDSSVKFKCKLRGYARGRKPQIKTSPKCVMILADVKLQRVSKARMVKSGIFEVDTNWLER